MLTKMQKLFSILFATIVLVLLCEFGQAKPKFYRHSKEMLRPMHRPLKINRTPYGIKPTNKPYQKPTKPFIDPSAPIPFPGRTENPRQIVDGRQ